MSALRERANRIATMGPFRKTSPERKLLIEKVAARLADKPVGTLRATEPWDDFLRRIGVI